MATNGDAQARGIVGLTQGECDLLHHDGMAKLALLGLALLIGCSGGGGGPRDGGGGMAAGAGGVSGTGGTGTCTGTASFWCVSGCGSDVFEAATCDGGQWGCPLGLIRSNTCSGGGTSGTAGSTGAGGSGGASGGSGGSGSGGSGGSGIGGAGGSANAGAGGGAGSGGSGPRGGAGGAGPRGGAGGSGPRGGAGGSASGGAGGAAGRGGAGGVGGCGSPPSHPTFNCAATYDEQAAVTGCGLGGSVTKGACGASWGWRCESVYTLTCIYDSQKRLAADRWCPDLGACRESCPAVVGFDACIDEIGRRTDAGPGN